MQSRGWMQLSACSSLPDTRHLFEYRVRTSHTPRLPRPSPLEPHLAFPSLPHASRHIPLSDCHFSLALFGLEAPFVLIIFSVYTVYVYPCSYHTPHNAFLYAPPPFASKTTPQTTPLDHSFLSPLYPPPRLWHCPFVLSCAPQPQRLASSRDLAISRPLRSFRTSTTTSSPASRKPHSSSFLLALRTPSLISHLFFP